MSIPHDALVIGFTGPFGSGCSTAREVLESRDPGFQGVRLSTIVKAAAKERGHDAPNRSDLQDVGNALRQENGPPYSYLVTESLRTLKDDPKNEYRWIAVDGLRNLDEIRELRSVAANCFIVALVSDTENRFGREGVRAPYLTDNKVDRPRFDIEEERDRDEGLPWGQQVEDCVRAADILIDNDRNVSSLKEEAVTKIKKRLQLEIARIEGSVEPVPSLEETWMARAFVESRRSACMKRRVGAVIMKPGIEVPLSYGYNENPMSLKSCRAIYGNCRKDSLITKLREPLRKALDGSVCPRCGEKVKVDPDKNRLTCSKCLCNVEKYYFEGKMLDMCPALHAEEMAILGADKADLKGATIYTTTFPCLQCAKKIAHLRLRELWYVEPYPSIDKPIVDDILDDAGVDIHRFDGVTGMGYSRVFGGQL